MLKLGKLAPRLDRRTLRLSNYLRLDRLPPAPETCVWDAGIADWGMMRNDEVGDCTCAAAGHQIQAWTGENGSPITATDYEIIAAYSAITGYGPDDPNSDNGAVMLDVLNYWRQTGIAGHKITAYASVNLKDAEIVKAALNLFGGLYVGLALPTSAQEQALWTPADGPDGRPGSWGGHAVATVDYDADTLACVTWGKLQRMDWGFFGACCDEAYAVLSEDWAVAGKLAPSGFDFAALPAELKDVTA